MTTNHTPWMTALRMPERVKTPVEQMQTSVTNTRKQLALRQASHERNLNLFGPEDSMSIESGLAFHSCQRMLATLLLHLESLTEN